MKNKTITKLKEWKLIDWNEYYASKAGIKLPPLTQKEITNAINFLRKYNYPKPTDCPNQECPKFRPACKLNVCHIATVMAGDF